MMDWKKIPELEPKTRSREYESYLEPLKDKVIFEYLFNAESHRWLDENILGLDPEESLGYQSMNILHYLGLKGRHKGIFKGVDTIRAIDNLKSTNNSDYSLIIIALERMEKREQEN